MPKEVAMIALAGIIMVGFVVTSIVGLVGKVFLRRRENPLDVGAVTQLDERLSRMEQAIDAMAVEMERVSEGQRFTTRLLSERVAQGEHAVLPHERR